MAKDLWFDPESNQILFSRYVAQMDSWQQALADGVVEPAEVEQQATKLADMLRALEPKLSDSIHAELTNILYEWAVLQAMMTTLELAEEDAADPTPG